VPLPPNVSAELQRDMARLGFVMGQIRDIEDARRKRLEQQPETGPHAMVRLLNRVVGVGIETADMLVHEVLSRPMRDRKAMARYAGLTGSPDESGAQRREQGLARAGNARVPHGSSPWAEGPRGMIQLAWRFLLFSEAERTGTVVPGPHCRLKSHGLTRLRADSRDKRRAPAFLPS
jgi:transposase